MKLTLRHATKRFDDKILFKQCSFTIPSGSFVAIKGKSGAGKSTLLNCLALIEPLTSGQLLFDETDVTMLSWSKKSRLYRQDISFIVQDFGLMPNETVMENLIIALRYERLSAKKCKQRCLAVLCKVNLADTLLDEPIFRLSGGEQQRVAIARCLLRQPRLLFADEPINALDRDNAADIMRLLQAINASGCTVVLVTHDDTYDNCYDDVIYL
ncbi:ABC transporter ATP-binding protein [Brochothrix campestris]|uniref:ABC transporter ATP-binding protein n=1 Tax=Brochothrix campestris FSL F6-1037 TaxID=1265861 RepID=W7CV59_9LIST|nr:ATP-binding cassette domain-containing protein [Brochothrix campestris]EUJ40570.1 ABC transporter ATP-binding protein [Brochothrix campestris FSL F6-1037]